MKKREKAAKNAKKVRRRRKGEHDELESFSSEITSPVRAPQAPTYENQSSRIHILI